MELDRNTSQYRQYRDYLKHFSTEEDQKQDEQMKSIAPPRDLDDKGKGDRLRTYGPGSNQDEPSVAGSIWEDLVSSKASDRSILSFSFSFF